MADFFISRAGEDAAWGRWIAQILQEDGYRVILQDWDFPAGASFLNEIATHIRESTRTVPIYSPDYFVKYLTRKEHDNALTYGDDRVLPVKIAVVDNPWLTRELKYIDLVNLDEKSAKERLLRDIHESCGIAKGPRDLTPHPVERFPRSPYGFGNGRIDVLVYLCDRVPQERPLKAALAREWNPERPLVCVLYGDEDHQGESFIRRLSVRPLPEGLPGWPKNANLPEPEPVVWPAITAVTTVDEFRRDLEEEVSRVMLNARDDDQPLVVFTGTATGVWCSEPKSAMQFLTAFLEVWRGIRLDPAALLLVILHIEFRKTRVEGEAELRRNQWQVARQVIKVLQEEHASDTNFFVMPELDAIDLEDAKQWRLCTQVKNFRTIAPEQITDIYDREHADRLVMRTLSPALRNLLK